MAGGICSTLILTWILGRVESGYIWEQEMVSDSRSCTSDTVLDLQELHILISVLRYWFWPPKVYFWLCQVRQFSSALFICWNSFDFLIHSSIKRNFFSTALSLGVETTVHALNFISKDANLILNAHSLKTCKNIRKVFLDQIRGEKNSV